MASLGSRVVVEERDRAGSVAGEGDHLEGAGAHGDRVALDHLEDVWLSRDPKEKRCFILEFVRCLLTLS